jgi:hypothetical protein
MPHFTNKLHLRKFYISSPCIIRECEASAAPNSKFMRQPCYFWQMYGGHINFLDNWIEREGEGAFNRHRLGSSRTNYSKKKKLKTWFQVDGSITETRLRQFVNTERWFIIFLGFTEFSLDQYADTSYGTAWTISSARIHEHSSPNRGAGMPETSSVISLACENNINNW